MKSRFLLFIALSLLGSNVVFPQSGTFDFEAGATQNGQSVSQTIAGVTLTIYSDHSTTPIPSMVLEDWSAYPPFTDVATMNGHDTPSCTFTFNQTVNIASILVADFWGATNYDLKFTPNTGAPVHQSIDGYNGSVVTLNFIQITSFVITNNAGGNIDLGVDNVVMTAPPTVTFTNGSAFTPAVTRGSSNQVLGRFQLAGSASGASLTAASIKLNGTRTGLSNLELWSSTDATFGGDTQVGSTVTADPGNGNSVSFSGFSSSIATAGTTYFLTGDVAAGASGTVRGIVVSNSNLTLYNGSLSGSITNAPLSSVDASLPVGLVSFSARAEGRSIVLNWITESEVENAGFVLERCDDAGIWIQIASFQTCDALKGQGNTSSRTEYTFTDGNVKSGKDYAYRLSDVSTAGRVTVYDPLSVKMVILPETTEMEKAYPNPFNPQTFIGYRLREDTRAEISVFDLLGRRVKTLFNGHQPAGSYHVYWNATDESGNRVPGGGYIIQMKTEATSQTQKVLLMK